MRCTTGTPGPPKPGHAWLSPNTSRSSTTASDCTPPSATAPPTKPSPTTTQRQQPPHDQTTEDCPRSLTRPRPGWGGVAPAPQERPAHHIASAALVTLVTGRDYRRLTESAR